MSQINFIEIFKIFGCKPNGPLDENSLEQLQNWGLIPRQGTYLCPRDHPLKLCVKTSSLDGFVWR